VAKNVPGVSGEGVYNWVGRPEEISKVFLKGGEEGFGSVG
jgi:hypothetical protein